MDGQTIVTPRPQVLRRSPTGGLPVSLLLLLWCVATFVAVTASAPAYLRAPLVVSFACFAPGWALLRPLRLSTVLMELICSLVLSVSLLILGSYLMLATHSWAPFALWRSFIILTIVAVGAPILWQSLAHRKKAAITTSVQRP